MADSEFARKQLLKHGWTKGSGLGKEGSGIKEAIKVKIKKDTTGVGHDPGKEFTYHWWDHVFNKAASNIDVKSTKQGVEVSQKSKEESNTPKHLNNRSLLYSGFVKAAVLQPTEDNLLCEVSCHENRPNEDEKSDEENTVRTKLTEEQLFSQCGGRTAHKGARHGLKQNAKLLRIEEQEKKHLEKLRKNISKEEATGETKSKTGLPSRPGQAEKIHTLLPSINGKDNISNSNDYNVIKNSPDNKRKKSRSKKRCVELEAIALFEEDRSTECKKITESDDIPKKKRKKSKKNKKQK